MGEALDAQGESPGGKKLALRFSHHIIEHLGLKLYQNRPTNVIAELVSNCWDAMAEDVWIDIQMGRKLSDSFIAVGDTGTGMSLDVLSDTYLIIGKPKDRPTAASTARYPMGRKGIGKLAPFGIARTLEVVTVSKDETGRRCTWLRLSLRDILEEGDDTDPNVSAEYEPQTPLLDGSIEAVPVDQDKTGAVAKFLSEIGGGTGTLILCKELSLLKAINADTMRQAMGRRFTVTLNRSDFRVKVNGTAVSEGESLPTFEFRIPLEGMQTEDIGEYQVRYWAGFVETASWPSDEAGVGVYAHGKIAQDRPFTFGLRGREIFTRYMYAVIEADFLDEMEEDVVSTDRRSVDWDHPAAAILYDWGQRKVRQWIEEFRAYKRRADEGRVRQLIDEKTERGEIPKIRDQEKEIIAGLLAEVTPGLGKDEAAAERVTTAVIKAYLHRPTRELLRKLWDQYGKEADPAAFLALTDRLSEAAIPEVLSVGVVFAQRAYALSVLHDMLHRGTEPDLQKLIEQFPWILRPDMERLTANQRLKTVVEAAFKEGLTPSKITAEQVEINEGYRPDFVFLSDIDYNHIAVVEIKSPREDLNIRNREQLVAYMVFLEQRYPDASRMGYLVGSNSQKMQPRRDDITILSWTDVFLLSRRIHIDLLAAMLMTANPDPDDDRVKQVIEFGGEEVWQLLERVAVNDDTLSELVSRRPALPA